MEGRVGIKKSLFKKEELVVLVRFGAKLLLARKVSGKIINQLS